MSDNMSAQGKHTPGPWIVGEEFGQWSVYQADGAGRPVARAFQGEQDARLIAAAPALLEALEALYESQETWPFELGKQARAAIRLARGGESA